MRPLLRSMVEAQSEPLGEDPAVTAFLQATVSTLQDRDRPNLRETVYHTFFGPTPRKVERPSYIWNLLLRASQRQALSPSFDKWKFPEEFDDPKAWEDLYDWIYTPEDHSGLDPEQDRLSRQHQKYLDINRASIFGFDLYRDVQSNVPQRYVSVPLLANLHRELDGRFGGPLRIIDAGCSQNYGMKKLASAASPFSPVNVMNWEEIGGASLYVRNPVLSRFLNDDLMRPLEVEEALGVDVVDPRDEPVKQWVKACSRYPKEFRNRHLDREYDFLDHEMPDAVDFVRADFTSPELVEQAGLKQQQYDIGMVATTLYMLSEEKQAAVFDNLRRLVKPDGLIIRQDFGHMQGRRKYRIYSNMSPNKPNQYRTVVTDMVEGGEISHEYFIWQSGRCRDLQLGRKAIEKLTELGVA